MVCVCLLYLSLKGFVCLHDFYARDIQTILANKKIILINEVFIHMFVWHVCSMRAGTLSAMFVVS